MKRHLALSALILPMAISSAYAESGDAVPAVTVSGYGTLAYTMTDTNQAEFGRANQFNGAKKSPVNWVDSNFGVQGTAVVTDWLSLTGQGLARKVATDNWGAELYWAYAKVALSRQLSVYVGRVGAPLYMISDYRQIGFANTMMRPPQEMYAMVRFDHMDGAAVNYRAAVGDVNLSAQLVLGSTKDMFSGLGRVSGSTPMLNISGLKILNVVADHGPLTVRLGYAQGNTTLVNSPVDALTAALNGAGAGYALPQLNQLASAIAPVHKRASFTSLGLVFDQNNLLLQSEVGKRKANSFTPDATAWYVMGGYRVGAFLPYVSHVVLKSRHSLTNTVPAQCPAGYPAACAPTLQALSSAVDEGLASALTEQDSTSIGLRWNFSQSADFKMQLDRIRPTSAGGLMINAPRGYNSVVTVLAAGVDFTF